MDKIIKPQVSVGNMLGKYYLLIVNDTGLNFNCEWYDPCGGNYVGYSDVIYTMIIFDTLEEITAYRAANSIADDPVCSFP